MARSSLTCVFIVNSVSTVDAAQTTGMLIAGMVARGHEVYMAGADHLSASPSDEILARAHRVVEAGVLTPGEDRVLAKGDLVVVRTNPARAAAGPTHSTALEFLSLAQQQGAVVINDPEGLRRASTKLYTNRIPAHLRPRTLVTRDPRAIRRFVEDNPGPSVLKPLVGTRGTDVFKVSGAEPNLNQIIEVLTRAGAAMVQDFVPEAVDGDVRILVLAGDVLRVDGQAALVRRVPSGNDFRSNVHVGAVAAPSEYDARLRELVASVAPILARDGLALCGLDVIGGKVVEINTFSAGGLQDANRFYCVDFTAPVLDFFEAEVARSRARRAS